MTAGKAVVEPFDGRTFRRAVGSFPTGVTVVTSGGSDEPFGMTANAFCMVSVDPPLVLVCVLSATRGARTITQNGVFAVNVLTEDQEALSHYFASRDRPRGGHAFKNVGHQIAITGSPILDHVAAYLDCRVVASHDAGDHIVFMGEVLALGLDHDARPLVYHRARYRRIESFDGEI